MGSLLFALREPQFESVEKGLWTTPCVLLVTNTSDSSEELTIPRQNFNILNLGSASASTASTERVHLNVPPGATIETSLGTLGRSSEGNRIDVQIIVEYRDTLEVVSASSTASGFVSGGG